MLGASDHTNSYRDIQGLGLPLFGILFNYLPSHTYAQLGCPKTERHQFGDWIGPGGCLMRNPDDQNLVGQATSDVQATQF